MNNLQSSASDDIAASQGQDVTSIGAAELNESSTLPLIHILRRCWVRRRMFFRIFGVGTLLSVVYSFIPPTMFTSSTTIMPPNSSSLDSLMMGGLATSAISSAEASAGSLLLGMQTPGAGFVSMLQSRTATEDLVNRFDLRDYYKERFLDDACKDLTNDTHILENLKSGTITISVRAKSAVFASRIAQGYVDELDHLVALDSTSAARRERIFLEGRLKEVKQDLDESAIALSQFSTKTMAIDVVNQGKGMMEASLKLQAELAAARSEEAGLREVYSADNVRVRAASARIEELQRELSVINGQSSNRNLTVRKEESALPSISELPNLGLTYSGLTRRLTVDEAIWEALTKQYEIAKVEEAKEIPTIRVLDVANIPQRKTSPVRRTIVIFGAMLSLLMALVSVQLAYRWEAMSEVDERKRFVKDAVEIVGNYRERLISLPGVRWIYALFNRPKQDS